MGRVEPKPFGQLFSQLFLLPLILVAVGVLVWLFFKASAEDGRSVEDLISDIESGGKHARRQDAYALALAARDVSSSRSEADRHFSPQVTQRLLRLFERSKDD